MFKLGSSQVKYQKILNLSGELGKIAGQPSLGLKPVVVIDLQSVVCTNKGVPPPRLAPPKKYF